MSKNRLLSGVFALTAVVLLSACSPENPKLLEANAENCRAESLQAMKNEVVRKELETKCAEIAAPVTVPVSEPAKP